MFAVGVCAWWGWPIAVLYHQGSRVGHPGRALGFVPIHGWNVPIVVLIFGGFWLVKEKVVPLRNNRLHPF